ncbi:MAG: hypothetical protein GY754_15145 [bacterium]|nr:hypothetical protein [bacterium]
MTDEIKAIKERISKLKSKEKELKEDQEKLTLELIRAGNSIKKKIYCKKQG